MTKADFYIGQGEDANWIGSICSDGYPGGIPLDILICINVTLYEELVVDFINFRKGIIKTNGQGWPWIWPDSRMTDYAYIFEMGVDKVLASHFGGALFDPVKVVQGEDLITADYGLGPPKLRIMGKRESEWTKHYQDYIKTMATIPTIETSL